MKPAIVFGTVVVLVGPLIASAQEAATTPAPMAPLLPPALSLAAVAPPTPGLAGIWNGDSSAFRGHVFGEIGVGAYWLHGSGPAFGAAPMLGSTGSLGV